MAQLAGRAGAAGGRQRHEPGAGLELLANAGMQVVLATNGQEALDLLARWRILTAC
jgi:hypothetical protein